MNIFIIIMCINDLYVSCYSQYKVLIFGHILVFKYIFVNLCLFILIGRYKNKNKYSLIYIK